MSTLYNQADKNNRKIYILGVFIFVFSLFLFFQPLSFDSSFFELKNFGINVAKAACLSDTADCNYDGIDG